MTLAPPPPQSFARWAHHRPDRRLFVAALGRHGGVLHPRRLRRPLPRFLDRDHPGPEPRRSHHHDPCHRAADFARHAVVVSPYDHLDLPARATPEAPRRVPVPAADRHPRHRPRRRDRAHLLDPHARHARQRRSSLCSSTSSWSCRMPIGPSTPGCGRSMSDAGRGGPQPGRRMAAGDAPGHRAQPARRDPVGRGDHGRTRARASSPSRRCSITTRCRSSSTCSASGTRSSRSPSPGRAALRVRAHLRHRLRGRRPTTPVEEPIEEGPPDGDSPTASHPTAGTRRCRRAVARPASPLRGGPRPGWPDTRPGTG